VAVSRQPDRRREICVTMQNPYAGLSPNIIKNRWPTSPSSPKKKLSQHPATVDVTTNATSPVNMCSPTRRVSPRRALLPTSPQKVELSASPSPGQHLPTLPFASSKRRQPPKAKNSSMFLTGLYYSHQERQHPSPTEVQQVVLPRITTASKQQRRLWYLWIVLGLSILVIVAMMIAQSRLTSGHPSTDAAFFPSLPLQYHQNQRQTSTTTTASLNDPTMTTTTIFDGGERIPQGETHSATEGVVPLPTDNTDGSSKETQDPLLILGEFNANTSSIETSPDKGEFTLAQQRPVPNESSKPVSFAVVHVVAADSDTLALDLYTIVASTLVQHRAGSQAHVVLYVTGGTELPKEFTHLLQQASVQVTFFTAVDEVKPHSNDTVDQTTKDTFRLDVFHRFMSDLAHYERILYLKPKIMARGSMDYLYHASTKGLLQENIIFADRQSPASPDIFLVRPSQNDTSMFVIPDMFHSDNGWGHSFLRDEQYELLNGRVGNRWDFVGADGIPGALYHYARYVRGSVSVVFQDAIHSMTVRDEETTFESVISLKDSIISALAESHTCWPDSMDHMPCRVPHSTFYRMDYTTAQRPEDLSSETVNKSPAHFWHNALDQINAEFSINIEDLHKLISVHPKDSSRFAYAFVVGGCDPGKDESYKNFLYQVLINAFVLKEAGSSSDIVLFVQMAYDSIHDSLPADDLRYLDQMNVSVRYIEKYRQESFDSIIMDKFRILQLTHYEKIIFCDSDVMLLESLDYLFELSDRGVLRSNLVFATELVPATGHIFMLSPLDGDWEHIMEISEHSGEVWNATHGWGHRFADNDGYDLTSGKIGTKWDFPGS
jgi:hypothetical protein